MSSKSLVLAAAILVLAGCSPVRPAPASIPIPTATEHVMVISVHITEIEWSKAFYLPGETAQWTVHIASQADQPIEARLDAHISSLDQPVGDLNQEITLSGGDQTFSFEWTPPSVSPRGY